MFGNHAADFLGELLFVLIFDHGQTLLKLVQRPFKVMLEDQIIDKGQHFGLVVQIHDRLSYLRLKHSHNEMNGLVVVGKPVLAQSKGLRVVQLFEHVAFTPARVR